MCSFLLVVFLASQVLAETNFVTGGNTSFCGNIWNFGGGPDPKACDAAYDKCYPPCWLIPPPGVLICQDICKSDYNVCKQKATPPLWQDHYAAIWVTPGAYGWSATTALGVTDWNNKHATETNNGARIVDLTAVRLNDGSTRFDSTYTYAPGPQRRAVVEQSRTVLIDTKNAQKSEGYYVVKMRVYRCSASDVCYVAIFEKRATPTTAFHGQTQTDVSNSWSTWTSQGYRLDDISAVQQSDGTLVFTSIWAKIPGDWRYWTGDVGYFQNTLSTMKNQGFYPYHVHVFELNDKVQYMGVFEHNAAVQEWAFIGGLTSGEFDKYWGCMSSKYRLLESPSYFDVESHWPH